MPPAVPAFPAAPPPVPPPGRSPPKMLPWQWSPPPVSLLLRYRLVREVDDLCLGRLVLLRQQRAAGGKYLLQHLRREIHIHRVGAGCEPQSLRLPGELRHSRGLRFSVGLRLCGSFLLSRGFCRSSLRGVFLRRQILRPVQVAAAAELRQNILQGKLRYFVVILSVFHGTSLLDAPGPYTVRCRTASYSRMAAAADAFREEILPRMGMLTRKSQFSATSRLMPSPSEPMTMAAGPLRSAS